MIPKDETVEEVKIISRDRLVMVILACRGKVSEETGQCLLCGAWPTSKDGRHELEEREE